MHTRGYGRKKQRHISKKGAFFSPKCGLQTSSQWIVKRKVNNVFTSIGILSIGQNGGWDGIFEGIRIQIAQGNNTFTNGDRYTFSTFVTQNPQGKQPQFNTNNQPLGVFIIPF